VFGNRVLREVFGPKRDEVTDKWRNCITGSFMIFTPQNIIHVIKSRRKRWAGYVAWLGERKCAYRIYRVLVGKPEYKR
jgi:hypothetical protein